MSRRTSVRAGLLAGLALAAAITATADASSKTAKPNLVASTSAAGKYTVKNTGSVAAGQFTIQVHGTYEYGANYRVVTGLTPGQSITVTLKKTYCGGVAPTVDVTADILGQISESSEADNYVQISQKQDCSGSA
jgi:VCBS repeat-containing protein